MLKSLIGAGHAEFAGMKQQDAQEFLIWLVSRVQRMGRPVGRVLERLEGEEERAGGGERGWGGYVDPTRGFKFAVQQRIQCLGCGGVKYRIDEQDNINIAVPERLKRYLPFLIPRSFVLSFLLPSSLIPLVRCFDYTPLISLLLSLRDLDFIVNSVDLHLSRKLCLHHPLNPQNTNP